jgi:hypothetical protein
MKISLFVCLFEGSLEKSQPQSTTAIFEIRFGFLKGVQKVLNGVRKCDCKKKEK